MILIDGAYHEGGGQIIRTAVALSALTGKPVKITNIRAKRCNPGLAAQHLTGILSLAKLCDAKVEGAKIGSQEIEFVPGKIKGGNYSIDVGTAGAISLILQALVLPAIHAKEEVVLEIRGGTNVLWGPTIEYFQHIFCCILEKMGISIQTEIIERGFYPKGGGMVKAAIKPCKKLEPLNLMERGNLEKVSITSIASENLRGVRVAERQIEGAQKILGMKCETKMEYVRALSPGSSIICEARYKNCTLGATSLGELYKPAEKVGEEAALLLKSQMDSGACLDEWMTDQILPYLAISGGAIKVAQVTPHAETNMWVIEQFLGKVFEVDKEKGIVMCSAAKH